MKGENVRMIKYVTATNDDMELLIESRLEMLKVVNELPEEYVFSNEFIETTRAYFENANQTTILAMENEKVIGCATLCYIELMPTFSHPTGKRSHLMNVYTSKKYRRQGIAARMLGMLIDEAKQKGVTEMSLDATEAGRPLYKKFGFTDSEECMVLELEK